MARELGPDEARLAQLIPPEHKLGPAMKALGDRQKLFVIGCVDLGLNHAHAAKFAGYAVGKPGSPYLRVQGHRLAHDERVQRAMVEEAGKRLKAGTVAASALVVSVIEDESADMKDRLKAAFGLMDRGGLHALSEHKVEVSHTDNRAEKLLRIVELCRLTGRDPQELLGSLADSAPEDLKVLEGQVVSRETSGA